MYIIFYIHSNKFYIHNKFNRKIAGTSELYIIIVYEVIVLHRCIGL